MPVSLIVNGVGYNYPVSGDENWAGNATNWAVAVTQNLSTLNAGLSNFNNGIFPLANGAVGSPSLRFINSPTSGLYRVSADVVGFTSAGVQSATISAAGLWTLGPVAGGVIHAIRGSLAVSEDLDVTGALSAGAASVASLAATGAVSGVSGAFSGAVTVASLVSSGAIAGTGISGTVGTFTTAVRGPDGSAGTVSHGFTNATGTGLFLRAANALGISTAGSEVAFFEDTGVLNLLNAVNFKTRTVTGATQTLDTTDTIVYCNRSGAVAITLPDNVAGRFLVVKDISGNASTNNVTITPASGTIDGASNTTINTDYGSFILFGDGTNWRAIASSGSSSGAVRTVNGTTSLASVDNIVLVNQSAACTITLPDPVKGKIIEVKDYSGTATNNNITVSGGSALIDGQSSTVLVMNYQAARFVSDGTNWSQL